ncbi:MAG: AgmX/PglI C-terminal domain-containing protein [Bacteriovoracaceae bacterium]
MDISKQLPTELYEVLATNAQIKIDGQVITKRRVLMGRSSECDVSVHDKSVSGIHAVLEVSPSGAILYDMNSTNGTFFKDKKIVTQKIDFGETFKLGSIELVFKKYKKEDVLPPTLSEVDPEKKSKSDLPQIPKGGTNSKIKLKKNKIESDVPYIGFPLAKDPKADYTEYIFEDADDIYPIFKYEVNKKSVEVIILFRDKIYSVDYLPITNGVYHLIGRRKSEELLEFPYLGKTEKVPLVEINGSEIHVHQLDGYKTIFLGNLGQAKSDSEGKSSKPTFQLKTDEIIQFEKDYLQVFVRMTEAPPTVLQSPIWGGKSDLRSYLMASLICAILIIVALNQVPIEEKKIDDTTNEKQIERIATIIRKSPPVPKAVPLVVSKNDAIQKTENEKNVIQKAPNQNAEKSVVKKEELLKGPISKVQTGEADKVPKPKGEPKSQAPKQSDTPSQASGGKQSRFSEVDSNSKGAVETFKGSADFAGSVSSLLAKGGSTKGIKVKDGTTGSGSGTVGGEGIGSGTSNQPLKSAQLGQDVGNLTSAASGKLDGQRGAGGLAEKSNVMIAGIPSDTIVLGSMDPDIIRRILREHIPQFRYCYQKDLDRTKSEVEGVIDLNFNIGASGSVSKAGVKGSTPISTDVQSCVINVLKGIQFPEPPGRGEVEVRQPINFYPKRI